MIVEIFRVKVKHYVGASGKTFFGKLSPVLFYFLWLFVVGFVSIALRFYGIAVGALLDDFVTALRPLTVSSILAVGIFLGMKGGITAINYEVEYIFTSTVKPRTFLLSDFLFQFIFLNLFAMPASAVMVTLLTYPRHVANLVQMLPLLEASIVSAILLGHILGMARNWLDRKYVMAVGWALIASVLLPLLDMFLGWFPGLKQASLPANLVLGLLGGGWNSAAGAVFIAFLATAYALMAGKIRYMGLAPVLTHVLTEPPKKIFNVIKTPKSLSRLFGIGADDGPLVLTLKIHMTRFVRDGSLWITAFVLLLLVYVNSFLPQALAVTATIEASYITIITLYTPLIPALLSINWVLSERNNIWLYQLSVHKIKTYVISLLTAYVIVSLVFSAGLLTAVHLFSGPVPIVYLDFLLLTSSSVFGSFFALLMSTSVKKMPSPFSMTSVFLVVVPLLGSQILSLPVLVARLFEPVVKNPPTMLPPFLMAYVLCLSMAVYYVSIRNSRNVSPH
ncbi:MAG: hypothetical protein NZ581_05070 [Candidatus Caldarchaeum sp.]|nr:hypothetical protein [Candidatus Caldarchaeum sp.]MDW8435550.1 hypothetical protein [Candidatus Caldarchaeum sp.]